jgi:hypothetical protein
MPLTPAAQTLADNFTAGLTADQRTNFNNALQNSPALVTQINAAVASDDLRGFSLLPAGTNAGGQFDPTARRMELPASIITTPTGGAYNANELTFVMGHEIQHAINRPTQVTATNTFVADVNRIGQTAQATHDYTAPLNARLASNRQDEATAHIAGFNATVSMVRSGNGNHNPSLEDIYRAHPGRMQDFIAVTPGTPATYALRAGLALNADMTMTPNATNTEAMGRHYFDQPGTSARIGANGDSNYQNYYATAWVGYAAQVERANAPTHAANGINTQMHVNMTTLGINEPQLERNGLNLGAAGVRQPFYDTSTNPPTQGNFDHTVGTNRHVPITVPEVHVPTHQAPNQQAPNQQAPDQRALPNHPAVQQALDALDRSPNIPADAFGHQRLNAAAGMALHTANEGLRADHIVFNDRRSDLIAVQGPLESPTAQLSTPLPITQAIATDLPAANRQLEALQPTQAPNANVAQPNRDIAPQQDNPVQEAFKPGR